MSALNQGIRLRDIKGVLKANLEEAATWRSEEEDKEQQEEEDVWSRSVAALNSVFEGVASVALQPVE